MLDLRRIAAIAVAAGALLLSGCGMINCGGAATNGAEAGDCQAHTTFFAASGQDRHAPGLRKS